MRNRGMLKSLRKGQVWPFINPKAVDLWMWGHSGLDQKLQAGQGCIVKPCLGVGKVKAWEELVYFNMRRAESTAIQSTPPENPALDKRVAPKDQMYWPLQTPAHTNN